MDCNNPPTKPTLSVLISPESEALIVVSQIGAIDYISGLLLTLPDYLAPHEGNVAGLDELRDDFLALIAGKNRVP